MEKAPMTVGNLSLWPRADAHGVKEDNPFFDGTIFHRVIPDFMIQAEIHKEPAKEDGYQFQTNSTIV